MTSTKEPTEVEPWQQIVFSMVIENAIKKLKFLEKLSSSTSVSKEKSEEPISDEVSKLIKEQRSLEEHHADLVALRNSQIANAQKQELKKTEEDINTVLTSLKDVGKRLYRSLQEDKPNFSDNMDKIKKDRSETIKRMEDCLEELKDNKFTIFKENIETELTKRERPRKLKEEEKELNQRHKDTSRSIKLAKDELNNVQSEYQEKINELQKKLKDKKTSADIQEKQMNQEQASKFETEKRVLEFERQELEEKIRDLEEKKKREIKTNLELKTFLENKKDTLNQVYKERTDMYEREKNNIKKMLDALVEQRETDREELNSLKKWKDGINQEKEEQAQKEEETRTKKIAEEEKLRDQIDKANKIRDKFRLQADKMKNTKSKKSKKKGMGKK